jgi:uncharacterized protein YrrD
MLEAISALKGYAIEASDGRIGAVGDFLFDDRSWRVRWLVVDTGGWLTGRKLLIHPSALDGADHDAHRLAVGLTKAQVEASPDIREDQPVSMQMESELHNYYGWDPLWVGGYLGEDSGAMAAPLSAPPYFGISANRMRTDIEPSAESGDPHLHSIAEVTGYHLHATDGEIGHVENFLLDSASWEIRYLIVATRNWWPGKHVLMSPHAVSAIDWLEHLVEVAVTREQVKTSPPWEPLSLMEQAYMQKLHGHYGWPGSSA